MVHISYTMCICGLPDMYTLRPAALRLQVYIRIRQATHAHGITITCTCTLMEQSSLIINVDAYTLIEQSDLSTNLLHEHNIIMYKDQEFEHCSIT